ncbi:MAG TPA: GNAT family N-acetyltransferase [Alphaproteobacteria bacterium]|jgi:CelD/BcsL family acetyltransferase involved in cellulose biosynthesis|nr:GNAT family N-acetyltransferase [Alphaproteobacteria bacterium]
MAEEPLSVAVRPVDNLRALASVWTDLEARADGSFFQSWAWTGCLAEERFTDPWLVSAHRGEKPVALGLLNRAARHPLRLDRPLYLGESGVPAMDSVFVEHNGLLIARGEAADLADRCWAALAGVMFKGGRWVLGGVPRSVCPTLPVTGTIHVRAHRPVPYHELLRTPAPVLDRLSSNARQQLRRALRSWEAIGPLRLEIARDETEAENYLTALKGLHQRYWTGRGKPGAFAEPFFERFHRALIRRTGIDQSVDLIRVTAGAHVVGYLQNFVHGGWVAAYQSGFDFSPEVERLKPGMVCHLLAMEYYRQAGMRTYDFLGGEARYKRTFANAETELLWIEVRHKSPWLFGRRKAAPSYTAQAG